MGVAKRSTVTLLDGLRLYRESGGEARQLLGLAASWAEAVTYLHGGGMQREGVSCMHAWEPLGLGGGRGRADRVLVKRANPRVGLVSEGLGQGQRED